MALLLRQGKDRLFYLSGKNEFTVGRRSTDLLICDDESVSRNHAVIKVEGKNVILIDVGSKYRTFHNGQVVPANTNVNLDENDMIRFGVFKSSFCFEITPIIVSSSCLSPAEKRDLAGQLKYIRGQFLPDLTNTCTHLTVKEISLTVKVIYALTEGQQIVSVKFWENYVDCVRNSRPPPLPDNFRPPLSARLHRKDISLEYNPMRRILFRDKMFVFGTSAEKTKYEKLIDIAGGTSALLAEKQIRKADVLSNEPQYLFLEDVALVANKPDAVVLYFEAGRRLIPFQELVLAIVQCSCEKDCNPLFDRVKVVFQKSSNKPKDEEVLVKNTEEMQLDDQPDPVEIPNTCPSSQESRNCQGAKSQDSDKVLNWAKIDSILDTFEAKATQASCSRDLTEAKPEREKRPGASTVSNISNESAGKLKKRKFCLDLTSDCEPVKTAKAEAIEIDECDAEDADINSQIIRNVIRDELKELKRHAEQPMESPRKRVKDEWNPFDNSQLNDNGLVQVVFKPLIRQTRAAPEVHVSGKVSFKKFKKNRLPGNTQTVTKPALVPYVVVVNEGGGEGNQENDTDSTLSDRTTISLRKPVYTL